MTWPAYLILALVTVQRLGELVLAERTIALQFARVWVIATLGDRWTTRIIVLPGAPLVRRGPYRWVDHPNYLIVIAEIALLPLVFGLPAVAAFFSVLNAIVLWVRIREENRALAAAS